MYTSLLIFIISFVAIVLMLSFKMVENKTGRSFILQTLSQKSDPYAGKFVKYFARLLDNFDVRDILKQISVLILHFIHDVLGLARHSTEKVHTRFSRVVDMVKGKEELRNKGASSVYLKDIKEHKESLGNKKSK